MVIFFYEIKWKYVLIVYFIKFCIKVWFYEKMFYNGLNVYLNKLFY